MSINKAILIGNVGKDPEINYIKEDLPVARFTLATSETYTKDGQKVTNTEWHNIVVWRGLAKVVEQYVKKGSKLYLEGKITNRSYEKDGQTKYISEIVVSNMQMLDGKGTGTSSSPSYDASPSSIPTPPPPPAQVMDDDLPF